MERFGPAARGIVGAIPSFATVRVESEEHYSEVLVGDGDGASRIAVLKGSDHAVRAAEFRERLVAELAARDV
jgi:hypothetical protein